MTNIIKEHVNTYTQTHFEFRAIPAQKAFEVSVIKLKKISDIELSDMQKAFGLDTAKEELESKIFTDFFEADNFYDKMLEKY